MSEADPKHQIVAERLVERLRSYAQGLGLDDARARQIIERVITEMPDADDTSRQELARLDMLVAAL